MARKFPKHYDNLDDELDALYEQHLDREIQAMIERKEECDRNSQTSSSKDTGSVTDVKK